ncbi:MAG: hypothetical protein ACRC3Z_08930 [Phocaeicola sp.]
MNRQLKNKQLVKYLMDVRRIEMISISVKNIIVQVSDKFTPEMGNKLIQEVGHDKTARIAAKDGNNYIVFPRF